MEPEKAQRILRQSKLYAAMRLIDLINGNNVTKGTGVTEDDMLTQIERAIEAVKKERASKQQVISVTQADLEWALGKFVKPNTMRTMIDRLKKRAL